MRRTATSRIPAKAGWCNPSRLPRGPAGLPLCRQCGMECPTTRNTFCSPECVHEWRLTTDPGYQRKHVFARDRGVCWSCGLDTEELKRAYHLILRSFSVLSWDERRGVNSRVLALGFIPGRSFWEMDHVVPVVEGGGGCGLSNLRTLCQSCHRRETAALAKRRTEARRPHIIES